MGPQTNLWTEYIASLPHVEYMMFPRLAAMAEVGWSPAKNRDRADFQRRLQTHLVRLQLLGVRHHVPAGFHRGRKP